jgi:hypothetical protein
MRNYLLAILTCAALASFLFAAPPTAPSNTRYATREVRVDWADFPPPPSSTADFLRQTAAQLSPQFLGIPADKVSDVFRHNFGRVEGGNLVLAVQLKLPADAKPGAKEFLDQLVAAYQKWAAEQFNRERDEHLQPLMQARDEADKRLQNATQRAKATRAEIRKAAGRADITPNTITGALTNLEDEKQKLELDVMAKSARRDALQEQVAHQSDQIEKRIENDPIFGELLKVVKVRDEALERARKAASQGAAPMSEVSEAVAAAAEARAKLLGRKRDAAAEAGGAALEGFNRELMMLSVDLRELEVRLKFVESHLPGLRDAMDRLDELQRAEAELAQARNEYDNADLHARDAVRATGSAKPPSIVVIRSENLPQPPEGAEVRDPNAR